jgi:8-oxo-dGTP pyrophosphatase MutT (NUDIX family)
MQITKLREALTRPLPGYSAQRLMAPGYRTEIATVDVLTRNPKIGAVLILLVPYGDDWHVVLTLRHKYAGVHSGQMSLPGGKREPQDKTLLHTALRETYEEIGVPCEQVHVVGQLTELYIPPSHFLVYPSVGYTDKPVVYQAQPSEVAEIVEIPLSFFLNPSSRSSTIIKWNHRTDMTVPAYIYKQYTIWGATAVILSELVYMLTSSE